MDEQIKIVLIGAENTGKTTFFKHIIRRKYTSYFKGYITSIGGEYHETEYNINNKNFKLIICDTPETERFRSILHHFLKKSDIVLIFFNYLNRKSFEDVKLFLEIAKDKTNNNNTNYALISSKYDLKKRI